MNIETIEIIDDSIFDSENFPVKNRSHAARRKKTYAKGKHRFETLRSFGFDPIPEWKPVICGILRNTNLVVPVHDPIGTPRATSISNVRRLASANDKLSGYFMEG